MIPLLIVAVLLLSDIAGNTAPRPMGPPERRRPRDWQTTWTVLGMLAIVASLGGFAAWMDPGPPDHPIPPAPPAVHRPYDPALNPADYDLVG